MPDNKLPPEALEPSVEALGHVRVVVTDCGETVNEFFPCKNCSYRKSHESVSSKFRKILEILNG